MSLKIVALAACLMLIGTTIYQTNTLTGFESSAQTASVKTPPVPEKLKQAAKPIIQLKDQIERQLPQKEINMIKQKLIVIAVIVKRYL